MSSTIKDSVSIVKWSDNEFKDDQNSTIEGEIKHTIVNNDTNELNTDINDILKNQFLELSKLLLNYNKTSFTHNSDNTQKITEELHKFELISDSIEDKSPSMKSIPSLVEERSPLLKVDSTSKQTMLSPLEIKSSPIEDINDDAISINSDTKKVSTFLIKGPINASKKVMIIILSKHKIGNIISVDFKSINGDTEYKNIIIKIDNLSTDNIYFNKLLTKENMFYKIYYYCIKYQQYKFYKLFNY